MTKRKCLHNNVDATQKSNKTGIIGQSTISEGLKGGRDYGMIFSGRERPTSILYIENLAYKLVEWAQFNEDALTLGEFMEANNLPSWAWEDYQHRSHIFKQAVAFAKQCIGNHREIGGLKRRLDSGMVKWTMPLYAKEWETLQEWYSRQKEDTATQGNITVQMTPIPKLEDKK